MLYDLLIASCDRRSITHVPLKKVCMLRLSNEVHDRAERSHTWGDEYIR
jgi:hypothetical protein